MKILHIPKTGGTAIKSSLIDGYRRHTPETPFLNTKIDGLYISDHDQKLNNDDNYIFFVRDPIQRFISQFVFLKNQAIGYGVENYFENLHYDNEILNKYDNVNDFAMDIFDLDLKMFKTFSDILISPENIERCKNNICFVGRTEFLENDFYEMLRRVKTKDNIVFNKSYSNIMPAEYSDMKTISVESQLNLRKFLNNDYEIIKKLNALGFIDNHYLLYMTDYFNPFYRGLT